MDSNHVIAIVLGGGKGTRLYPLTKVRSKPAVPFGGKYRLVDIPISNCINAGFKQIFILTQFNSVSLHQHLSNTYIFDVFSNGFVEILAAEQNFNNNSGWYEGTADAVRKNFSHLHDRKPSHYIILSGDQLYSMDLRDMFNKHVESKAKITIACHPVSRTEAAELGILSTDDKGRIQKFLEKPGLEANIDEYRIPEKMRSRLPKLADKEYLGSMGMYIFDAETLDQALDNEFTDFRKVKSIHMFMKDIGKTLELSGRFMTQTLIWRLSTPNSTFTMKNFRFTLTAVICRRQKSIFVPFRSHWRLKAVLLQTPIS